MNTENMQRRPAIGLFNHAAFYRSWFRDGSHPDLGQLIHTEYSTKRSFRKAAKTLGKEVAK